MHLEPDRHPLGGTRDRIASGVSIGIQDSLAQLKEKIASELAHPGNHRQRPREDVRAARGHGELPDSQEDDPREGDHAGGVDAYAAALAAAGSADSGSKSVEKGSSAVWVTLRGRGGVRR